MTERSEQHFRRVIISGTGPVAGEEMQVVHDCLGWKVRSGTPSEGELICSGVELKTMDDQLRQPIYMQMTRSVTLFPSQQRLASTRLRKRAPMRIEMETAAEIGNTVVAEFAEPVSIVYGRPNLDRSNYGRAARIEDPHLAAWMARYSSRHPSALLPLSRAAA